MESLLAPIPILYDPEPKKCQQAKWYEKILDVGMGEVLVCRDTVRLARQFRMQRVHLEMDRLEIVQLWEKMELQQSCGRDRARRYARKTRDRSRSPTAGHYPLAARAITNMRNIRSTFEISI